MLRRFTQFNKVQNKFPTNRRRIAIFPTATYIFYQNILPTFNFIESINSEY